MQAIYTAVWDGQPIKTEVDVDLVGMKISAWGKRITEGVNDQSLVKLEDEYVELDDGTKFSALASHYHKAKDKYGKGVIRY